MNKEILIILLLVCSFGCVVFVVVNNLATTPAVVPLPATKVNQKDGAEMVMVSAGEFLMGSNDKAEYSNEKPHRKVYVDGYWIYKTEVTVAQYRKFCVATGRKMPTEPSWKWLNNHPIVNVTWNDAKAYADWAKVSLPTEAQWEKAARGTDGRIYPWGNKWDASKCVNNSNSKNGTKPVGSISAGVSQYGCMDMSGNVWEWCSDWYKSDYYKTAPMKNPIGPDTGYSRVMRGGSWYNIYTDDFGNRCACRCDGYPSSDNNFVGFRCASPGP